MLGAVGVGGGVLMVEEGKLALSAVIVGRVAMGGGWKRMLLGGKGGRGWVGGWVSGKVGGWAGGTRPAQCLTATNATIAASAAVGITIVAAAPRPPRPQCHEHRHRHHLRRHGCHRRRQR